MCVQNLETEMNSLIPPSCGFVLCLPFESNPQGTKKSQEKKYWLAPSLDGSAVLSVTNEAEEEGRSLDVRAYCPCSPN